MVRIEVFPILTIHPASLLLTPRMRYTLQIVGGPDRGSISYSNIEIKFDIEDKKVATVDVFREVTGHKVGDTNLFYEIVQLPNPTQKIQRSIISKKTIPVRVRLVTDIEIPYNNGR